MSYSFALIISILLAGMLADISVSHAQTADQPNHIQVRGVVVDADGKGIERATIRLYAGVDTVRAVTEKAGSFSVHLARHPDSLLSIRVAHLAYEPIMRKILLAARDSVAFDAGRFVLKDRFIELDVVAVSGRPEIFARGDTIFFETKHIQVAEGAFTEELMRRLPGMEVDESGRLSYLGKRIAHVRLNGIDFFGGDVLLALQNLPADLIRRLQLIEDHGIAYELMGIRSSKPRQILNLEVDEDKNRGQFTRGNAGYGTERTHQLNAAGNQYNKENQRSILLGTNNIERPVTYDAGGRVVGSAGAGGINNVSGISATYRDKPGETITYFLPYSFNKRDNRSLSGSASTQTYGADTEIVTRADRQRRSEFFSHLFGGVGTNSVFSWRKKDLSTTVDLQPNFRHNTVQTASDESTTQEFYQQGELATVQQSVSHSAGKDVDRSGELTVTAVHRFAARNRTVFLRSSVLFRDDQQREEVETVLTRQEMGQGSVLDSAFQQGIHQDQRGWRWNSNVRYPLQFEDQSLLILALDVNFMSERAGKQVFDRRWDSAPIDSLGNATRVNQQRSVLNAQWQGVLGAWSATLGGQLIMLRQLHEDDRYAVREIRNNTLYATPTIMLMKAGPRRQVRITYQYQTNLPTFSMLNPLPDYRRPEYVVVGNPHLKSALSHQLVLGIQDVPKPNIALKHYTFHAMYHMHRIVQDLRIHTTPEGLVRQVAHYRNLSGDAEVKGEFQQNLNAWELSPQAKVSSVLSGSASLAREGFYESGAIRRSLLTQAGLRATINYLDVRNRFALRAAYNFQHNSSPNSFGVGTIHTFSTGLTFKQQIWKHVSLEGNLSKSFNHGYQGPANANPFGINLSLEGRVYKNHLTWRLSGNDLLNQGLNQGRTVSRNEVLDYYSNTLGRYMMATLNWRFGKFAGMP